jgi:cystathionine beta-lyase
MAGPDDPLASAGLDALLRRDGTKWSAHGDGVIGAWIADSDAPVCPVVRTAIDELLDRGDLTYPHDDAPRRLALAFAERQERLWGWRPDPDGVVPMSDLVAPMSIAVDRLTSPGAGVILQTPAYAPFVAELQTLGRPLLSHPWVTEGGNWVADLGCLDELAAGAEALILVNPHNPTGRVWERSELESVAETVLRHDLVVISDEVHAEIRYTDLPHVPFASLSREIGSRTITLTSASKSFNLAGTRCAVMHLGDSARLDPVRHVPLAQLGQVSNVGFAATLAAWSGGDDWLAAFVASLARRRDELGSLLGELLPEVGWIPPEATFLAWLDCRDLGLDVDPAEFFLQRALVALNSGLMFGPGGDGHARLNFATSPSVLTEIVERMVTAVDLWRAGR